MAQTLATPATLPPVTADAFLADRQRFWGSFTSFTVGGIVSVIIVVLVTLYFIL